MALKQGSKQPAGQFEQGDGSQAAPAATATAAPADPVAAAGVSATTAIAKASASAVMAPGGKMVSLLQDMKDALPAIDFGVLPRLVGSNGNVMDKDKRMLGSRIKLELVSWNDLWVVSPGDDTEEAKEAVRYSKDGKTIDGTGQSVQDYVKYLRETGGYDEANVKQYCELIGILTEAEKPSEHLGGMVQVSLSPQSRKLFEGYRLQESVKLRLGKRAPDGAEHLLIQTEVKSSGSNTYTLLKVSAA